jgi:hypothetical protein
MGIYRKIRNFLGNAFALDKEKDINPDDSSYLDCLAQKIVDRGLATPSIIMLESLSPLNLIGSQIILFLSSILSCVFSTKELEKLAGLLENRKTIQLFCSMLENKSTHSR